ncbi:MAG TPA: metal-dependent hydrolase [Mycobacteriales bacterium]|jgi:L-ascorbate metabolism protein UlaG (beta-lactamase superfamily)|nr:metal-dependent hydrolase [Mycobacteriales bacterium]
MTSLKFHGHACFSINFDDTSLLIDPWLTGNPEIGTIPDGLNPTHILVTHNHTDHVGDAIALSKRFGADIITTPSAGRHYLGEGATVTRLHLGGRLKFDWGSIKCVQAIHDSPLAVGETWRVELGAPCGFVVDVHGKRFYHAGDTALFGDMALFAPIDVAMLPIDGKMVMEPEDAVIAARLLDAALVVPMHWRQEDPERFVTLLAEDGRKGTVLAREQTLEI